MAPVIPCEQVGLHSENRDGLGCSSAHVHDLLKNICSIGHSQSEVRGICLEVPHEMRTGSAGSTPVKT